MSQWAQLATLISDDHREELAAAIIESLACANWGQVCIEIRDHHLHTVITSKSKLLSYKASKENKKGA